jgi:hypothetical protein
VAQEFADRSYELQHIFVHSILKENARKGVVTGFLKGDPPAKSTRVRSDTGEMMVISSIIEKREDLLMDEDIPRDWYPFDPYVLPRSKVFVTNCFLEYSPQNQEEDMLTDSSYEDSSDEDM